MFSDILDSSITVYGFMGNIGEGKNYIAEQLFLPKMQELDNQPTLVMAFADHFKIAAVCYNNLEYDKVFINKDTQTRQRLQQLGTEQGRNKYGEDIWIKIVYNWMKLYASRGIRRFIITDVRFENEVNFIKAINGTIIRVYAPDRNKLKLQQESNNDPLVQTILNNHPSEVFIREFKKYDYFVDNRQNPIMDVVSQVNIIATMEKLKNDISR